MCELPWNQCTGLQSSAINSTLSPFAQFDEMECFVQRSSKLNVLKVQATEFSHHSNQRDRVNRSSHSGEMGISSARNLVQQRRTQVDVEIG